MARRTPQDFADLELGDVAVVLSFPAPNAPASINAVKSVHWAKRRALMDPWKHAAYAAWQYLPAADKQRVQDRPCDVAVVIPFTTAAHRDPHNYVGSVVKAIVDGLTSNYESPAKGRPKVLVWKGVWPDDTPEWVSVEEPLCVKGGDVKVALIPWRD